MAEVVPPSGTGESEAAFVPPAGPLPVSDGTTNSTPLGEPGPRTPATLDRLPAYSRSLLRIRVPVVVTLAQKRQPLGKILELGPGSIIQFDKSCEEMLNLEMGGRTVAVGEAVKVGDKFGLRVNAMILPGERFVALAPRSKQPKP